MTTWVKHHFRDPKHAMAAISIMSLSMGALGFGAIVLGIFLAH